MFNEVKNLRLKKSYQTVTYLPHFISWVVVAGMITNLLAVDGGTVNTGNAFVNSSLDIVKFSLALAKDNPLYSIHIVCSSDNIFDAVSQMEIPQNVVVHSEILSAKVYYKSLVSLKKC